MEEISQTSPQNQPLPQATTPAHSRIKPLALSLFLLLLLLLVTALAYQNYQLKQSVSKNETPSNPEPLVSPTPNPTANWKTYTNATFNISVLYPPEWDTENAAPNLVLFKPVGVKAPQGEYQVAGVFLRMLQNSYDQAVDNALAAYGSRNQENITTKVLDGIHIWGTISQGQIAGWSGGVFILKNTDGNAFEFSYPVINNQSYVRKAQLMAGSLKRSVINTNNESASPQPLENIPILSTTDWKEVSNNGVSFKIPPEAGCNDDAACSDVSYYSDYNGRATPTQIYVRVDEYEGGSRREYYLASHREITSACNPLYEEALFGHIKALQTAVDESLCQGNTGGIVTVVGNKIITVGNGLSYNPDTQEINRFDIRDTIVSTLTINN